jgi:hypothetical protein
MMVAVIALLAAALYWFAIRRWFVTWGADEVDCSRAMIGDDLVPEPTYAATLAVTIDAPQEDIWPWLVQMGYRRGGLYSYDWLDRLFGYLDRLSADRIMPEFQRLAVGDVIPIGRGGGFPVAAVDPHCALVLAGSSNGVAWAWQFGLRPVGPRQTKLVSRNAVRAPRTIGTWLFLRAIEPAAFLMTRRMLLGIKARAEAAEARGRDAGGSPARAA